MRCAIKRLQVEVIEFFDAFVEAFRSFNGSQIADRYLVAYVAVRAGGSMSCLLTRTEVARYFQSVVDGYFGEGCRSCRYKDIEVVPIGSQSALGTVTWDLLREDGRILTTWRESYNLVRREGGLRIFVSIDH